jgi:hypothetical protein
MSEPGGDPSSGISSKSIYRVQGKLSLMIARSTVSWQRKRSPWPRVAASIPAAALARLSHRVSRIEPRHNLNAFVTSDPGACSI